MAAPCPKEATMTTRPKNTNGAAAAADRAAHIAEAALQDGATVAADAGAALKADATAVRDRIADTARRAARDVKGAMDELVATLPQDSTAHRLAGRAVDTADAAIARVQSLDLGRVADDARRLVRQHPVAAGLGAAVVGFALIRLAQSALAARDGSHQ
jgi:hypothetical protein